MTVGVSSNNSKQLSTSKKTNKKIEANFVFLLANSIKCSFPGRVATVSVYAPLNKFL